jgi:RNA polymerase sigma-70 factor (ECF subfamily)
MGSSQDNLADYAFREHRGQVYRFLLRKTGDHHDAEELTQRVFADASLALRRESARPDSMLAWLYAIAERRFVDEVRRRTVARAGLRLLVRSDEAPDLGYSRDVARALRAAVAELPQDQRRVVVLKLLEGRSFAEIAAEVGASEAACKMRLSRAIAQIKRYLNAVGLNPNE